MVFEGSNINHPHTVFTTIISTVEDLYNLVELQVASLLIFFKIACKSLAISSNLQYIPGRIIFKCFLECLLP